MAFSSRNKMAALLSSRYVLAAGLLAGFGLACGAAQADGALKKIEVQGSPTIATSRTSTLAAAARGLAANAAPVAAAGPHLGVSATDRELHAAAAEPRANFSAAGAAAPGFASSTASPTGRLSSIKMLRPAMTGVSGVEAASVATVSVSSFSSASRSGLISTAALQPAAAVGPTAPSASMARPYDTAVLQPAAAVAPGALSASTGRLAARPAGAFRTGAVVAAAVTAIEPRSSLLRQRNTLGATSAKMSRHQHLPK